MSRLSGSRSSVKSVGRQYKNLLDDEIEFNETYERLVEDVDSKLDVPKRFIYRAKKNEGPIKKRMFADFMSRLLTTLYEDHMKFTIELLQDAYRITYGLWAIIIQDSKLNDKILDPLRQKLFIFQSIVIARQNVKIKLPFTNEGIMKVNVRIMNNTPSIEDIERRKSQLEQEKLLQIQNEQNNNNDNNDDNNEENQETQETSNGIIDSPMVSTDEPIEEDTTNETNNSTQEEQQEQTTETNENTNENNENNEETKENNENDKDKVDEEIETPRTRRRTVHEPTINSKYQLNDKKQSIGTLKFIGEVQFAKGTYYGLELDQGFRGKNNGMIKNIPYFKCRRDQGIFLTEEEFKKCKLVSKKSARLSKRRRSGMGDVAPKELVNRAKKKESTGGRKSIKSKSTGRKSVKSTKSTGPRKSVKSTTKKPKPKKKN